MKHQTDQPYEQFFSRLTDFKTKHCTTNSTFKLNAWQELCEIYKDLEKQVDAMPKDDILENVRHTFKQQYYDFAKHSVLNSRVIDWPKGYQGDNITLEYLYKGYPVSEDLFGQYIDLYTISRTLGVGVRERKEKLKDILTKEMFQRDQTKFLSVLNIGCGSSKELYEIGVRLNDFNGKITCVDFDSEALNFSEITLASRMIDMKKFEFIKLNVLKLVDAQYMESTLGKFELMYSVGLFDYIQDKGIIKLFQSLFTLHDRHPCAVAKRFDVVCRNRHNG